MKSKQILSCPALPEWVCYYEVNFSQSLFAKIKNVSQLLKLSKMDGLGGQKIRIPLGLPTIRPAILRIHKSNLSVKQITKRFKFHFPKDDIIK